jgi:hypothetical protein
MGNTLSAVAGLRTSSVRNVGEFGGLSVLPLSCEIGSPFSERGGFSMRGVVVPEANPPSFKIIEANACPLSSSEPRPAPLDRLLLSCSADITVHSSQSYSCRSCNDIENTPSERQTRRAQPVAGTQRRLEKYLRLMLSRVLSSTTDSNNFQQVDLKAL